MSLVAYGNSSDEDSDDYDSSDEKQEDKSSSSNATAKEPVTSADAEPAGIASTLLLKLPSPKKQAINSVIEEDDEFLHKKAVPTEPPPKPPVKRGTVQITIPALPKLDEPKLNKREKFIGAQPNRPAGLLNLLPKPTFGSFSKKSTSIVTDAHASTATAKSKQSNGFIPHSVAKVAATSKKIIQKPPTNDDGNSGSDSSDDDDYFSFHTETKLPEVSQQEINAMVAKKAADMKTATTTYLQSMERQNVDIEAESVENVSEQSRIDDEALAALCGAKRARRGDGPSVVIELTGDQVLPNRDEWLRNQLQSTTEYQPRGLVDEEPAAGTRKKHQITYLAHQAKANEQELQAMWAANRHTRRQTQNKYGF